HFAFRLVVHQHARGFDQCAGDELASIEFDLVAAADGHAHLGDFAIDLDQAVGDALLERAARAEPGLREHLVQPLFESGGGAGVSAALQGQLVAGFFTHFSCSDEAGTASSSWVCGSGATVGSGSESGSGAESSASAARSSGAASGVCSSAGGGTSSPWPIPPAAIGCPSAGSPLAGPVSFWPSNWNCGSSSPISLSSDRGGNSSSRLSPE